MSNNCIIILNYNDCERVEKLVKTIEGYNSLEHILIVDNCSIDGSFNRLKKLASDKVHVIETNRNGGYATGNNYGVKYAKEKWNIDTLYFANPDVLFDEDVILNIEENLWQSDKYGVATVLVKEGYNAWELPGYWGTVRMLFLFLFMIHKKKMKKELIEKRGIHDVGVTEGSFFAIKSSVFDEIGGFDERNFLYLEENILAYRLRQHGYKEIISADEYYIHEHSQSISKEYKSKARAFKLFLPSFLVYLKYYLRCNSMQINVFKMFYGMAYFERILYDVVKYMIK